VKDGVIKGAALDVFENYRSGFLIQTNYRIKMIDVKVNSLLVRSYSFSYVVGDNTKRSLLGSIVESAFDQSTGVVSSMPATTFSYQKSSVFWTKNTRL